MYLREGRKLGVNVAVSGTKEGTAALGGAKVQSMAWCSVWVVRECRETNGRQVTGWLSEGRIWRGISGPFAPSQSHLLWALRQR